MSSRHDPTVGEWRDVAAGMLSLTWRELRAIVLYRDEFTCRYCGDVAYEADHVWPRALGGEDVLENLQALCERCNRRKGSEEPPLGPMSESQLSYVESLLSRQTQVSA